MGNETQKANNRRTKDIRFINVFFAGKGIDIGAGGDLLDKKIFTNIQQIDKFDLPEGNAQEILNYKNKETYDFVYSSHCLEHIENPSQTLISWFNLVKEGGYMIIVVPDEDLYEQGIFPSRFNGDHKNTFTIYKTKSWSPVSINIIDILKKIDNGKIIKLDLIDDNYDYTKKNIDQTWGKAEAGIEFIIRKIPK